MAGAAEALIDNDDSANSNNNLFVQYINVMYALSIQFNVLLHNNYESLCNRDSHIPCYRFRQK